jgi:Sel1 repeat
MGTHSYSRNARIRRLLVILGLTLPLTAQSDFLDQPIKGALGKVLGDQFDLGAATHTLFSDRILVFDFVPSGTLPDLTEYQAAVSPLSYRIYSILASGKLGDRRKCLDTAEPLFYGALAKKYGGNTYGTSFFEYDDHSGWYLTQSKTGRAIHVKCDAKGELLLRYSDGALTTEAEAEQREVARIRSEFAAARYAGVLPRLRELAGQGNPWAQTLLGLAYSKGYGVDQDDREAEELYGLAARKGWFGAQFNLGVFYQDRFRLREAETWLSKAAEGGLPEAQENLGQLYHARGVLHSDEKSFLWTMRAAEQGRVEAQYNTCFDYADGIGVGRDMVEAYKWCAIAAHSGHEKATSNADHLARQMKPDEVSRGRTAAELWIAKNVSTK